MAAMRTRLRVAREESRWSDEEMRGASSRVMSLGVQWEVALRLAVENHWCEADAVLLAVSLNLLLRVSYSVKFCRPQARILGR